MIYLAFAAVVVLWPQRVDGDAMGVYRVLYDLYDRGLPRWLTYNVLQFVANVVLTAPIGLVPRHDAPPPSVVGGGRDAAPPCSPPLKWPSCSCPLACRACWTCWRTRWAASWARSDGGSPADPRMSLRCN